VSLLETIVARAGEKKIQCLLAGGHAVIVHGYQRSTFDVDLVVRRADRDAWVELLTVLGFTTFHEGPTFLQFNPPSGESSALDLMFTNEQTFAKLHTDAVPNPLGPTQPPVVSLRHLVAMKCHAIRHGHAGRVVRDADDLIHLFLANRLDPSETPWRDVVAEFGTAELHEKLKHACKPD
jgi:hypothetical protein